jgi:hypothetical protein
LTGLSVILFTLLVLVVVSMAHVTILVDEIPGADAGVGTSDALDRWRLFLKASGVAFTSAAPSLAGALLWPHLHPTRHPGEDDRSPRCED